MKNDFASRGVHYRELYKDRQKKDMHIFERKPMNKVKFFFILALVFFFLIAVTLFAGYLVFNTYFIEQDELSISVNIDGPTQVSAGEEVTYTVQYKNPSGTKLTNVSLIADYSSGFANIISNTFEDRREETAQKQKLWNIDEISATEGEFLFRARIIAPVASVQSLTFHLNYTPENFSSNFEKSDTIFVTVENSDISFDISGSDIAFIDEEVTYTITYENTSEEPLKDIRLSLEFPQSFELTVADPNPTSEQKQKRLWEIPTIDANKKEEISFSGHFIKIENESETFQVELALKNKDEYSTQDIKEKIVVLESKGNLNIDLLLNGSTESEPLVLGEEMNFSLVYENQSGRDLENITMTAEFVTSSIEILDLESLKDQFKGKQDTDGNTFRIAWGGEQVDSLKKFQAGEKGVLNFSMNVRDREILTILDAESLSRLHIDSSVSLELSTKEGELKVVSNSFANDIKSDLDMSASFTRVNEEEEDLQFEITWLISNTIHEVKDLAIVSSFSDPVTFDAIINVDAGEFNYNDDRNISWTLNRMPANLLTPIEIVFRVRIPESLKFSEHTILNETKLTGTDRVTGSVIEIAKPEIVYTLRDQLKDTFIAN